LAGLDFAKLSILNSSAGLHAKAGGCRVKLLHPPSGGSGVASKPRLFFVLHGRSNAAKALDARSGGSPHPWGFTLAAMWLGPAFGGPNCVHRLRNRYFPVPLLAPGEFVPLNKPFSRFLYLVSRSWLLYHSRLSGAGRPVTASHNSIPECSTRELRGRSINLEQHQ